MTMTQDSGGGGTAANLCPPSPSDLAGQINNLITRIENLEKAVAELQGQDVTATQLSDLSQQVGWVYDVTYLGVPGWTQTAAGTLIPPEGLALSTLGIIIPGLGGNPAQLLSMDSDGNPVFSVNTNGTTTGGGGGVSYLARFDMDVQTITQPAGYTALKLSNPNTSTDTIGATFSATSFTLPATGWYYMSCTINIYATTATTNTGNNKLQINPSSSASVLEDQQNWSYIADTNNVPLIMSAHGIIDSNAGSSIAIEFDPGLGAGGGTTVSVYIENLSVIKL